MIFPSLFSLAQYAQQLDQETLSKIIILSGQSTSVERAKTYRSIHSGQKKTIFATHSQIFWDRCNLRSIQIFDASSSIYETQQEPRYGIQKVVSKMENML